MGEKDHRGMGLVLVYTGDGKGKTTAALGLSLRQAGWGKRVLIIQFMKGAGNVYGEKVACERFLPSIEIEQHGRDEFVNLKNPDRKDKELAMGALERAKEALRSREYGMVVLDEINVALSCGLIPEQDVLDTLASRPPSVDIVLTGRGCPPSVIERADMVSEVREIKHHFRKGVESRAGIEY